MDMDGFAWLHVIGRCCIKLVAVDDIGECWMMDRYEKMDGWTDE